jgi:hypothetical protein
VKSPAASTTNRAFEAVAPKIVEYKTAMAGQMLKRAIRAAAARCA